MSETELETSAELSEETAVVRYDALAPIGTKRNLQGLLERQMGALRQVLPRHVTPERLVKTLMVAINRQPELLECTQESVLESVGRAGELGLDLSGTLGEAYLVPFNNKVKIRGQEVWRKQATFIPGYRGLAKLARQSGEVKRIEANVVYEKDDFDFAQGTEFRLQYRRSLETDRGTKMGAYALVEFKDGGFQADWMTVAEIERIRQRAKSKDSPAWRNDWDEMGKKTVFRRLSKWLPLSGEKWTAVLEADNADYGFDDVIDIGEVSAGNGPNAADLAAGAGKGAPEPGEAPAAAGQSSTAEMSPEEDPEAAAFEEEHPPEETSGGGLFGRGR